MESKTHRKLIDKLSTEELKRRADKARRRGLWTQEDVDYIGRRVKKIKESLNWK